MIDIAIRRIRSREEEELARRELEDRLATELFVLECAIRFPWMETGELRRIVVETLHAVPAA